MLLEIDKIGNIIQSGSPNLLDGSHILWFLTQMHQKKLNSNPSIEFGITVFFHNYVYKLDKFNTMIYSFIQLPHATPNDIDTLVQFAFDQSAETAEHAPKSVLTKAVEYLLNPNQNHGRICIGRNPNNQIIGRCTLYLHDCHSVCLGMLYLKKEFRNKRYIFEMFQFLEGEIQRMKRKEITGLVSHFGPQFFKIVKGSRWLLSPTILYEFDIKEKVNHEFIFEGESKLTVRKEQLEEDTEMIDMIGGDTGGKYIGLSAYD